MSSLVGRIRMDKLIIFHIKCKNGLAGTPFLTHFSFGIIML
jgi:hypothetical protein